MQSYRVCWSCASDKAIIDLQGGVELVYVDSSADCDECIERLIDMKPIAIKDLKI